LDSKDASLQETRMKSRVRILAAEKALLALKDELHPSKSENRGSLLGQLELLNGKIRGTSLLYMLVVLVVYLPVPTTL
jgi:hypothetical protein